jgi:hypothetical protein
VLTRHVMNIPSLVHGSSTVTPNKPHLIFALILFGESRPGLKSAQTGPPILSPSAI